MNNSFKGALPKDKTNSRLPSTRLSRRDLQNETKAGKKKSSHKVVENSEDASSLLGIGAGSSSSLVDGFVTAMPSNDVRSGYELTPKPKVPCIPMFSDRESFTAVGSLFLNGQSGAEVVYKGKDIEDSSLSVLFVGSKSRLDLQSCKPVN